MSAPAKLLLTIPAAAAALSVSRGQVYRLLHAGFLKSVTISGDQRIPVSEIERLAAQGCPRIPVQPAKRRALV